MARPLNIGFLIDDLDKYFSNEACKGAELAMPGLSMQICLFFRVTI